MQPLIIHNKMPVIFCHIYDITLVNYPHDITGSHAKIPSITMIYILISKPFPPKQTLLTLANSHFSDITRPSRNKRPGWAWKRATSIAFRRQIRWFMDVYDRHVHTLTKLWWVDWPILQPGGRLACWCFCLCRYDTWDVGSSIAWALLKQVGSCRWGQPNRSQKVAPDLLGIWSYPNGFDEQLGSWLLVIPWKP